MPAALAATEAVARLDREVARMLGTRDRAVLAFSGGLGSLLIAALARKRCDLLCVVVGFRGAADVQAAVVAQKFLDYSVAVLSPAPRGALQVAREIRAAEPGLSPFEAASLVPLALVEQGHPSARVLSGFGLTVRTPALRRALGHRGALSPGLRMRFSRSTRVPLFRMAEAVGLPESFVRAAPRTPPEGSGVGPALRALAHSREISLGRLLGASGQVSDNQEPRAKRLVFKSSDVD